MLRRLWCLLCWESDCCSPCLIAFDRGSFRWTTCPWWLWCILCTTVSWGWPSPMPCWTRRRSVCLLSFGCHRSGVGPLLSIFGNSSLRDESPPLFWDYVQSCTNKEVRDAKIPLSLRPNTSTYIWVHADTEYRYEFLIIPIQFKNMLSPWLRPTATLWYFF